MHYGKFRAKVVDVKDPEFRGRIRVLCPKVYGKYTSPWCLPCSPLAFNGGGILFVPKINEMIWIEFEEGNADFPIWVGGLWKVRGAPLPSEEYNLLAEHVRIVMTEGGHRIIISDKVGGKSINIQDSKGSSIHMNSETGDVTIHAKNNLKFTATNRITSNGLDLNGS